MLDYTIQDAAERAKQVAEIISTSSPDQLTNKYLEILSDYIIFAMSKEEKKEKNILTENRMITVNKRETSYQGLVSKFENGEDGLYNLITDNKNILLTPKLAITQQDIEEIPPLKDLKEAIELLEKQEKAATGKKKFLLKKQLIEMRQNQYVIKSEFKITGNNTYQTIIDSEILILDGLGNEAITTWSRDEILLSILDNRLQSDKITILCSEFSLDDLKKLYKVNYNDEVKVNQIIEKINEIKK